MKSWRYRARRRRASGTARHRAPGVESAALGTPLRSRTSSRDRVGDPRTRPERPSYGTSLPSRRQPAGAPAAAWWPSSAGLGWARRSGTQHVDHPAVRARRGRVRSSSARDLRGRIRRGAANGENQRLGHREDGFTVCGGSEICARICRITSRSADPSRDGTRVLSAPPRLGVVLHSLSFTRLYRPGKPALTIVLRMCLQAHGDRPEILHARGGLRSCRCSHTCTRLPIMTRRAHEDPPPHAMVLAVPPVSQVRWYRRPSALVYPRAT